MIFAACFALRGHGTHINILWFCSWSARFALGCKSIRVKVLINIRVYVSIISSKVSSGSEYKLSDFTLVREVDGLI